MTILMGVIGGICVFCVIVYNACKESCSDETSAFLATAGIIIGIVFGGAFFYITRQAWLTVCIAVFLYLLFRKLYHSSVADNLPPPVEVKDPPSHYWEHGLTRTQYNELRMQAIKDRGVNRRREEAIAKAEAAEKSFSNIRWLWAIGSMLIGFENFNKGLRSALEAGRDPFLPAYPALFPVAIIALYQILKAEGIKEYNLSSKNKKKQ